MPTIRINIFHWTIKALEKERLAKQLESDFAALADDPDALRLYKSESKVFDQASADGLSD